jgi:hypothetical protein
MNLEDKVKKERIGSIVGGSFCVIWGGFYFYCYSVASRIPIENIGRIYEYNNHGTLFYLTKSEHYTLIGIPIIFISLGIITEIYNRFMKSRKITIHSSQK